MTVVTALSKKSSTHIHCVNVSEMHCVIKEFSVNITFMFPPAQKQCILFAVGVYIF